MHVLSALITMQSARLSFTKKVISSSQVNSLSTTLVHTIQLFSQMCSEVFLFTLKEDFPPLK